MSIRRLGLIVVLFLPHRVLAHGDADPDVEARVLYWEGRVKDAPALFPAWVELGLARLELARKTADPLAVIKAREATLHALKLQETYEGFRAMMLIENHAHRFEEALAWGLRAADASVGGSNDPEPEILAGLIEAELGAGRTAEAAKRLDQFRARTDFHAHASRAQLAAAQERFHDAVREFELAGNSAAVFPARTGPDRSFIERLERWAELSAARTLLAAGRSTEAHARLPRLRALKVAPVRLAVFEAQLALAAEKYEAARAIAEAAIVDHDQDPELHHLAMVACKKLGARAAADLHFRAAQRELKFAVAAGEYYTLEALAALHLDAGVDLDDALVLAEKNYEHKRDRGARKTLDALRAEKASRAGWREALRVFVDP